MNYNETKSIIDSARDILVGKLPAPNTQVEQITLALLYKFMDDIDQEAYQMGGEIRYFSGQFQKYGWQLIMKKSVSAQERMNLYIEALDKFFQHPNLPTAFREIFKNATVPYRDPEVLTSFLRYIDRINYSNSEVLGDAYEYLLSILGSQGELGQFRTPRHIIDFIVKVVSPQKNEKVLDPACGTAGFLISTFKYILENNENLSYEERNSNLNNLFGYDIEPSMVRLADMNMYLHGCTIPNIIEYDTLTQEDNWSQKFDLILANPPFFTPKGGITPHNKFSLNSKKAEVLFSEYILEHVNRSGRGAFIVPEGIVSNIQSAYVNLRKLMLFHGLYAVVGLHEYVFKPYAGVSTHIIFFDKKLRNKNNVLYLGMIEEDGYLKGENRTSTPDLNEIPCVINELLDFKKGLQNENLVDLDFKKGKTIHIEELDENIDLHPYSYYEKPKEFSKMVIDLFNIEKGTIQSSKSVEGDYTFITASNEWSTHTSYTHDTEALIFVHGAGGSLAKVHYINGKFITSDLCFVLTPKKPDEMNIRYYYAYFTAFKSEIRNRLARGTNKKSINRTRFENYEIPFPDLSIQNSIGSLVSDAFSEIEKLKMQIAKEFDSMENLFK